MQSRRPSGLTPLAIVLPHPPLPRRRSSLLSIGSATSPHTPRSCHSPCLPIYNYPANRKSTDSWNSSNADDMEFDWKPDQVLLLTRTLDALPAHLVTPFNGPVPPSNLLDKIARGVAQAKGPADWPHSIRATRVKLLELARARAKEEKNNAAHRRHVIKEEDIEVDDASNYSYFHDGHEKPLRTTTTTTAPAAPVPRRPLYRQSSMDFITPGPDDIKDNANITRLSNRLQRSDRLFPNPVYHPYSRAPHSASQRSASPPTDAPSLVNQSTTSSSTLDTDAFSELSAAPRVLRRSASTISSSSMFTDSSNGMMPLADPRIQRVRRSDSVCAPAPPPKDFPFPSIHSASAGLKRAPSYGAIAQEARQEHAALGHARTLSGSYPSSDEEEKARTRRAKKIKTKTGTAVPSTPGGASTPPSSVPSSPDAMVIATAPSSPVVTRKSAKEGVTSPKRVKGVSACRDAQKEKDKLEEGVKSPKSPSSKSMKRAADKTSGEAGKTGKTRSQDKDKEKAGATKDKAATSKPKTKPQPMNLQRNPSMFGAELPPLRSPLGSTNKGDNNANIYSGVSHIHARLASPPPLPHKARSPAPAAAAAATCSLSPAPARALSPAPVIHTKGVAQLSPPFSPASSPLSPTLATSPMSPASPQTKTKTKTLRRVRRLAPARRISFGSLLPTGATAEVEGESESALVPGRGCLGSAFQLI
ncbi:unnamed protein product [Cyclocybe aegerita]|uniref:Uncharacterized protein n=1 Tax=Cyclocybe aegerita TaxID=1973307 RepID=A0A8S0XWM0_CYCAE|nr:unnamed protein product [Cyclocybe aegerita]